MRISNCKVVYLIARQSPFLFSTKLLHGTWIIQVTQLLDLAERLYVVLSPSISWLKYLAHLLSNAMELRSFQSFILVWIYQNKYDDDDLIKNFSIFYGTWCFITMFTRDLHCSLSWARSVQSEPSHHIPLRSI
jgi:hypothetical protein